MDAGNINNARKVFTEELIAGLAASLAASAAGGLPGLIIGPVTYGSIKAGIELLKINNPESQINWKTAPPAVSLESVLPERQEIRSILRQHDQNWMNMVPPTMSVTQRLPDTSLPIDAMRIQFPAPLLAPRVTIEYETSNRSNHFPLWSDLPGWDDLPPYGPRPGRIVANRIIYGESPRTMKPIFTNIQHM